MPNPFEMRKSPFKEAKQPKPSAVNVISEAERWWNSIENEEPDYYHEVDLGHVIVHMCGSKDRMEKALGHKMYPGTSMFTSYGGKLPAHVWLQVKIVKGEVVMHKWATGHEMIRLLNLFVPNMRNADKY